MKTITKGIRGSMNKERFAIIELSHGDLDNLGCGPYQDPQNTIDPSKALQGVLDYDRRAYAKLINESGPLEILSRSLTKLAQYLDAAKQLETPGPTDPAHEVIATVKK